MALAAAAGEEGGIYASHIRGEGRDLFAAVDEADTDRTGCRGPGAREPSQVRVLPRVGANRRPPRDAPRRRRDRRPVPLRRVELLAGVAAAALGAGRGGGGARRRRARPAAPRRGGGRGRLPILRGRGRMGTDRDQRDPRGAVERAWTSRRSPRRWTASPSTPWWRCSRTIRTRPASVTPCTRTTSARSSPIPRSSSPRTPRRSTRASPAGSLPVHPREYGTFPRALATCREDDLLPLEAVVRKMTSLPAERFGLRDRGRIAEGAFADLVLFDPVAIRDTATYAAPHAFPEGIDAVVVNGTVAWEVGIDDRACRPSDSVAARRAGGRIRTDDLPITSRLRYRAAPRRPRGESTLGGTTDPPRRRRRPRTRSAPSTSARRPGRRRLDEPQDDPEPAHDEARDPPEREHRGRAGRPRRAARRRARRRAERHPRPGQGARTSSKFIAPATKRTSAAVETTAGRRTAIARTPARGVLEVLEDELGRLGLGVPGAGGSTPLIITRASGKHVAVQHGGERRRGVQRCDPPAHRQRDERRRTSRGPASTSRPPRSRRRPRPARRARLVVDARRARPSRPTTVKPASWRRPIARGMFATRAWGRCARAPAEARIAAGGDGGGAAHARDEQRGAGGLRRARRGAQVLRILDAVEHHDDRVFARTRRRQVALAQRSRRPRARRIARRRRGGRARVGRARRARPCARGPPPPRPPRAGRAGPGVSRAPAASSTSLARPARIASVTARLPADDARSRRPLATARQPTPSPVQAETLRPGRLDGDAIERRRPRAARASPHRRPARRDRRTLARRP